MSKILVGSVIVGGATKDAIHVAVAPATAGCDLQPGDRVDVSDGEATRSEGPGVGVVDPFLRHAVERGERFYVFVRPDTVKDLRHAWNHPSFPDDALSEDEEDDECSSC